MLLVFLLVSFNFGHKGNAFFAYMQIFSSFFPHLFAHFCIFSFSHKIVASPHFFANKFAYIIKKVYLCSGFSLKKV